MTALRGIMSDAAIAQRLAHTFIQAFQSEAPAAFGQEIARDRGKKTRVVRAAGIEPT